MKNWLSKLAKTDEERIEFNIDRLEAIRELVHELAYAAPCNPSGSFRTLDKLLKETIVVDREKIYKKLKSALIGPHNQKIVLDAPMKFQKLMLEAEELLKKEILKETKKLKELTKERDQHDGKKSNTK